MRQGNRVLSLVLVVAAVSMLLASCGQSSNCSGISFGTTGGGSGGGVSSGGTVCGGGSNNNNGGGSASALLYYLSVGPAIAAAGVGSNTFTNVVGFNPVNIGTSVAPSPDMVIANKKFLYFPVALNGTQGQVLAYSITRGSAALNTVTGSPFSTSQASTGASTTDPQGRFLFIGDSPDGQIAVMQINASTGALTPAPGSPFTILGISPNNLSVDGTGHYLYVGDRAGMRVYGFSIDQNTGALTPIAGSPFAAGLTTVQADSTGKFLYGVDGITAGLFVVTIEAGTGALLTETMFPTTNAPYGLAVHPSGSFVFTFSADARGNALPLEGFQVDATGTATTLTGSPFTSLPNPLAGKFDQGGTHLVCPLNTTSWTSFLVDNTTGAITDPLPHLTNGTNDDKFAVTD
jgi:6-phosphogluconolactonase (cycloisomerase 2 family)